MQSVFVRRQWITETRTPGVWTTSIPTGWVGQGNLAKLLVKCKQTPSAECEIWPFCLQGPNLCVEHVKIDTYLNVYIQYICYSSIPFLPTTAWRKWLISRWVSLGFQHFRVQSETGERDPPTFRTRYAPDHSRAISFRWWRQQRRRPLHRCPVINWLTAVWKFGLWEWASDIVWQSVRYIWSIHMYTVYEYSFFKHICVTISEHTGCILQFLWFIKTRSMS